MDDGQEVVVKVPNPNTGVYHFTIASEVATMSLVRDVLRTPIPKIHAWNSRAEHPVGAEYIIMEKAPGVQLSPVWKDMKLSDTMQLRLNLAFYQEAWLSVSFREYGGLCHAQDLPGGASEEYLYKNENGDKIHDTRFTVGPMTGHDWLDCGRADLKCDRGPWRTSSDYRKAVGLRELSAISSMMLPRQTIMVCGPAPFLWHNDLHEENIFVDPVNPSKIVSIIEWQSGDLVPLFDHNPDPAFIQYSGLKPETLDLPELEDTSTMSQEERARAIGDYFDKALFIASRKIASKKTPAVYRTIAYQQTEAFDILTIARRIFEFGEAHLHALMVDLRKTWPGLPLVEESSSPIPFPIDFDDARLAEIEDDGKKAVHSIQIMNEFKARLGLLWPDKDAISHEQYDEIKAALRELKAEVISEFARSEDDRLEFERLWPFDD